MLCVKLEGMKIAKYIQQAGLASRREAEAWVRLGRVRVRGEIVKTPATVLKDGADADILLDGKKLPRPAPLRLWRYHKPAGLIVSRSDSYARPTIFSQLPKDKRKLISIGRLDMASEGLLLLTNDGQLARKLELPASAFKRYYRVCVRGDVSQALLDRLSHGITIDGIRYAPARARLEKKKCRGAQWILITLSEGKNREVRILMKALGLRVERLIRIGFGPFRLARLRSGAIAEVPMRRLDALQKRWR